MFPNICLAAGLRATIGALILHKDSGRKDPTEAYLGCVPCSEDFLRDFLTSVDQEVWGFLVVIDTRQQSFYLGVLLDNEQLYSTTKSI